MSEGVDCCCAWGAAVHGEWPEFECNKCAVHGESMSTPDELCKRHKRGATYDSMLVSDVISMGNLKTFAQKYIDSSANWW